MAGGISKAMVCLSSYVRAFSKCVRHFFNKVGVVLYRDFMHTLKLHPALLSTLAGDSNAKLSRRFIFAATSSTLLRALRVNFDLGKFFFLKNFIIFTATDVLSSLASIAAYVGIFLTAPANIELAAQIIATLSIFFIAIPVGSMGG